MTARNDICISGAGPVGSALALGAAQRGLSVALCDPALATSEPPAPYSGAAYAISRASVTLFQSLGVWEAMAPHATEMRRIVVADGRVGQPPTSPVLEFDAAELGQSAMAYMVEERILTRVLRDACQKAGVHLHPHSVTPPVAPTTAGWDITTGETRITAPLWAITEGRYSQTARQVGFGFGEHDYQQSAIACCVKLERPHDGIAYQYFTPHGPFAALPLTEDHMSIVWSEERALAQEIAALPPAEFATALGARLAPIVGAFEVVSRVSCFPLRLGLAHEMAGERRVILGDAAHRVHPIAGQGLNLGLGDVRDLLHTLSDIRKIGQDLGQSPLLMEWEAARRGEVTAMAQGFTAINTLFSNDNPILRGMRGAGVTLVKNTPRLRQMAMSLAAG